MGYRVEYASYDQRCGTMNAASRAFPFTAVMLLCFLILVNCLWPRGSELLRDLILPGDAAVTAAAIENLAIRLESGETVAFALESFCRDVLQAAEFAPG